MGDFLYKFFGDGYGDEKMLVILAYGMFMGATLILLLYVLRLYNRKIDLNAKAKKVKKK